MSDNTPSTTLKITAHTDRDSDIELEVEVFERSNPNSDDRSFVTLDIRSDDVEFSLFVHSVSELVALRDQLTAGIRVAAKKESHINFTPFGQEGA